MVKIQSFWFVEPKSEQNIKLSIEVWLSGNSSFYLDARIWVPNRYILYRREAINQFRQRVGLENSYYNYLAICCYFSKIKTFSVVDKIFFFEKLNYSTVFFPVLLLFILYSILEFTLSGGHSFFDLECIWIHCCCW